MLHSRTHNMAFLFDSRARRSRVKRVRESIENSLGRTIELIESYARVCYLSRNAQLDHLSSKTIEQWTSISILLINMPCVLQISSIIEIEVEMDSDVLAAEAAGNAVRIIFIIVLILFENYSNVVIQRYIALWRCNVASCALFFIFFTPCRKVLLNKYNK